MVRLRSCLWLVSLLGCALVATDAAEQRIARLDGRRITTTEIDNTVQRLMRAGRVTGMGIAVLNNRRVAYLKAYGECDTRKHLPLTIDSVMTNSSNGEGIRVSPLLRFSC